MANGWILAGLGFWVMVSRVVLALPPGSAWNSWIAGVIAVGIGWTAARHDRLWQGMLAIIAGSCLVVAGFIQRLDIGSLLVGKNLAFGALLVVAGLSLVDWRHLMTTPRARTH